MEKILIREVKLKDAPRLSEIARDSVEPFKDRDFDDAGWVRFIDATSVQSIEEIMRIDSCISICALVGNTIAGFITIRDLEKIEQLFVDPGFQKSGIARSLWEYARKRCMGNSSNMNFWVKSSSYAIPIYERFGFSKEGSLQEVSGIRYQLMRFTAKNG